MGNCHALFGKGPTEKGSDMSTSPVTYFTPRGPGGETPPGYSPSYAESETALGIGGPFGAVRSQGWRR